MVQSSTMAICERVLIESLPLTQTRMRPWDGVVWPADWVSGLPAADEDRRPVDVLYRLRFTLNAPERFRLHASADERYDLRINGQRVGRGPQRSDLRRWAFESYDVALPAGDHTLWAWVSSPGLANHLAPSAQLTRRHGWLLVVEGEHGDRLTTGRADWQAHVVTGVRHVRSPIDNARFAGGTQHFDARAMDWLALDGRGDAWHPVRAVEPARVSGPDWGELDACRSLCPASLPAMLDRPFTGGKVRYCGPSAQPVPMDTHDPANAARWQSMLDDGAPVVVPAHQRIAVLIDWPDYVCAYPQITLRGGRDAEVQLDWAEAMHTEPHTWSNTKPHRDKIADMHFVGRGDAFIADGSEHTFEPLWWRAGRYTLLTVQTQAEPLEVVGLHMRETRYPLETDPLPEVDDAKLQAALPILERGLLMSMHEHYTDSPYYEQLMYVGDTRLESLCTHVLSLDDRLPMRAIEMFGGSRIESGLTQARYPSSTPQIIPGFSLLWVAMLHDLARWRGRRDFVNTWMPAARSVLEAFVAGIETTGLPRSLPGWNFLDWVPAWDQGIPPQGTAGLNGAFAWHLAYTLNLKAELEDWFGQHDLAQRDRRFAGSIAQACEDVFFDARRGLYADDPDHTSFSQHAQCFAVLSGQRSADRNRTLVDRMLADDTLHAATIYFSHYLLEALAVTGHDHAMHRAFDLWRGLPDLGFKCPPESPEPTRSDCHAWGSHPLYRVAASVLGVSPGGFGFATVDIAPLLGPMRFARGVVPHHHGPITVQLTRNPQGLHADLQLPANLTGHFHWQGQSYPLKPGHQTIQATNQN